MRKTLFENGNFYHVYNRGVEKRNIFVDVHDRDRFFQSMDEFNVIDPIGSLYINTFRKQKNIRNNTENLVNFICYCLNPNHFHFILQQVVDKGIERFMHRLSCGYTNYFNKKYKRSGVLFQGRYKALHIDSDSYLLHASAYVNLNNKVHDFGGDLSMSSWKEYMENLGDFCKKSIVLDQFKNVSEYKIFAENALRDIKERKKLQHEIEKFEY